MADYAATVNLRHFSAGLARPLFAIALALVFGASIVRGLTGFGLAIILVPLLGLIIAPVQAVVISILLQLLAGPIGLKRILADAERETAIPIAIAAVLATPFGVWLLSVTPADVARVSIAMLAIAAFGLMFVPAKEAAVPGRKETWATGHCGGCADRLCLDARAAGGALLYAPQTAACGRARIDADGVFCDCHCGQHCILCNWHGESALAVVVGAFLSRALYRHAVGRAGLWQSQRAGVADFGWRHFGDCRDSGGGSVDDLVWLGRPKLRLS